MLAKYQKFMKYQGNYLQLQIIQALMWNQKYHYKFNLIVEDKRNLQLISPILNRMEEAGR